MSVPQRHRRAKPVQEGRKAPYIMVGHWVAFHAELAPQAKAVYLVMLAYATGSELSDGGSSEVWPARESIAEALGWTRPQSCDQWIEQLAKAGAIEVLPPEKGDGDRNNHYIVHGTPPEGFAGFHSQSEFSAARRAKRGHRKGEAKPQVSDDAECRITRMGDNAPERTTDDAVDRTYLMRQGAHEQEPPTRTIELEKHTRASREAAPPLCDPPVRMKLDDASGPLVENTEGNVQADPPTKVDAKDNKLVKEDGQIEAIVFPVEADPLGDQAGVPGQAREESLVSLEARKGRRSKDSFRELSKDPCAQASFPIVARFERRTNRLSAYAQRKWRAAVTNMLNLEHDVADIEGGMDLAVAEGGNWAWLESKTLVVRQQRLTRKKSRAETKLEQQLQDSFNQFGSDPQEILKLMYTHLDVDQSPRSALEA